MSLTADDFWKMRDIIKDEVRELFHSEGRLVMREIAQREVREIVHDAVSFELDSIRGQMTALENDIKEIYFILDRMEKRLPA